MKMKQQIEVYLDGKLSASERVAFLEEVKTNDEIDQWFRQNIENAEDSLSEEVKQRLLANICPPVELKSKSNVRSIWTVRHIAVACVVMALVVAAALGGYFWRQEAESNQTAQIVKIETGIGERSKAVLPDGTEVSLNAMTSVTYDCSIDNGKRQVNVEGEAYFDVAKDVEHPFVINVNQMEVTCLGTALNVRNYADEQIASVVLVEGKVRVNGPSSDMMMDSNSRVVYDRKSKLMAMQRVEAKDYTCWLNREVRFNDQTLEDVAKELERNFHVQVIITQDELKNVKFTGYLGASSLRNVLDIMSLSSNMSYYMDHDSVVYFCERSKN